MPRQAHALWRVLVDALDVHTGAELIERPDWVQLRTPSSVYPSHNRIMRARLHPQDANERIAAVVSEHRRRGAGLRLVDLVGYSVPVNESVTIEARYCGPPRSGNGGYSCGVLAEFIEGVAEVTLKAPPPLDTPLRIERRDDGSVAMLLDSTLVATAKSHSLELEVPAAPSLDDARSSAAKYRGFKGHIFPTCFVCGPDRGSDALQIFPGPTANSRMVAAPWTPGAEHGDASGVVREAVVSAALDCPGYFALAGDSRLAAVLGRLTVRHDAALHAGRTYVAAGWGLGQDGRKRYCGTAIYDADGTVVAAAHATWIEIDASALGFV